MSDTVFRPFYVFVYLCFSSHVASTSLAFGEVSNPASPMGEQPGHSGYQIGIGSIRDHEPGPSGYPSGRGPTSNQNSGYASGSGISIDQEPGPSGYPSGQDDHLPNQYQQVMDSSPRNVTQGLIEYSANNQDCQQPVPSGYEAAGQMSSDSDQDYIPGDPEPGPCGYHRLVVDESAEDESVFLQVVSESFDQEPGPSRYRSFRRSRDDQESGFQPVGSASHDQEPGPSGYESFERAYQEPAEENDELTGGYQLPVRGNLPDNAPVRGNLLDNEPGPSGFEAHRGSLQAQQSRAVRHHISENASNDPEPGPSDYLDLSLHDNHPGPSLLGLVHGEISNPPSPLGGQAVPVDTDDDDDNVSNTDSPQAGPSGGYFGAAFLPDPISNPSSPLAGPSTAQAKRRNVPPDSFAHNNKRSRFEPSPGPSNAFLHRNRNHLNVSR